MDRVLLSRHKPVDHPAPMSRRLPSFAPEPPRQALFGPFWAILWNLWGVEQSRLQPATLLLSHFRCPVPRLPQEMARIQPRIR